LGFSWLGTAAPCALGRPRYFFAAAVCLSSVCDFFVGTADMSLAEDARNERGAARGLAVSITSETAQAGAM